jgi:hypothetical protein
LLNHTSSYAGFDPRIHQSHENLSKGWMAGSSPAMTDGKHATTHTSSYAGFDPRIHQSHENLEGMGGRVKPGHDGWRGASRLPSLKAP